MATVNAELEQKIDAVTRTNSDMNNLLANIEIGVIFLDMGLKIQRFTPRVNDIINLINSDIGRPIGHIASNMQDVNLARIARDVLDTLNAVEQEVTTEDDRWYIMSIRPYRALKNVVDGVVITFVEISEQKNVQISLQENQALLQSIYDSTNAAIYVIEITENGAFHIVDINPFVGPPDWCFR